MNGYSLRSSRPDQSQAPLGSPVPTEDDQMDAAQVPHTDAVDDHDEDDGADNMDKIKQKLIRFNELSRSGQVDPADETLLKFLMDKYNLGD